jgi:hypothetical protein
MADSYKPGDQVPYSGIYRVIHDPRHVEDHEVSCVSGKTFPLCRDCPHPTFELVKSSPILIEDCKHFKR